MKNKLGKRVLTMALAMVLTFASCVTAFAQMGTAGDHFFEYTEYFYASKGTGSDATKLKAYVSMTTANDATNFNTNIKDVLSKDYFINGSTIFFKNASDASDTKLLSVNTENLATMVTKEAVLSVETRLKDGWGYLWIEKVTNSDSAFDGRVIVKKTDAVTNKLTAAGYAGNSIQFQIPGSGRLPGLATISIQDYTVSYADEKSSKEGTGYLYYYDAAADSFILVDEAQWYSSNRFNKWTSFSSKNAKAISKGAYVFTTDKIADTAVKKVDVSLTTDSKFSTKDYVGKAMEVYTKAGKWYFGNVTTAMDFDPSFTFGGEKTAADVDKKLASVTLPATTKTLTFNFAHSGDLPGTAQVTVDVSSMGIADGSYFLYYFDEAKGIFTKEPNAAIVKNGMLTITITHCSKYLFSTEELPTALTSITVKTGDATNAIPFVIALICGCAAIGVVVVRRRTVK